MKDTTTAPASNGMEAVERRIVALDGFRGLWTVVVVISHFYGEVKHGIPALMLGWLAVDGFFVLSGYLIGRLILDKSKHRNFFWVFYVRRICRTFPIYFFCVIAVFYINDVFHPATTYGEETSLPLWSYMAFVQNFWMVSYDTIGQHWLAPTWTLAVEEQFYLIAPAMIVFTPRRFLMPVLVSLVALAMVSRIYFLTSSEFSNLAAQVMLISNGDVLVAGIIAAVALKTWKLDWARYDQFLRVAPVVLLTATMALAMITGSASPIFQTLAQTMVAAAFSLMIMSLVRGSPEAPRYENKVLRFFGNISYAVYLTHLATLGILHNLILGTAPDIATPAQIAVTTLALPVTVLTSWILTKIVEEPITSYGRSFKWSKETVERQTEARPAAQASANS